MSTPDIVVFIIYLLGTITVALAFMRRNNSLGEMFGAGGRAPWWVSGLSAYMTLFSAGSFVVWGGLAYRQGLVAVTVLVVIGLSGLITAYWIAPRWKLLEVASPAEFVEKRFGSAVKQYITWALIVVRVISSAIALYALAAVLDPLLFHSSEPSFARSAALIAVLGAVVVGYTMIGGLWAVLMTDVLQFIILTVAVVFIVVMAFSQLGGVSELQSVMTPEFLQPINADFTVIVLVGWVLTHTFVLGADWAFVQRHIAVPKPADARKSMLLFSALYIISPCIWLAPAMFYRLIDADANPEQAYILISAALLPVGMLGLMAAAMFSATASMISSQINVFAGSLTNAFFSGPETDEGKQVWAGRIMTVVIGAVIVVVALSVPFLGGAQTVVFALMSLLISPIFAPVLWGLFSQRIGASSIWIITIAAGSAGFAVKFGDAFLGNLLGEAGPALVEWLSHNARLAEMLAGVVLPLAILIAIELYMRLKDHIDSDAEAFFKDTQIHPESQSDMSEEGADDLSSVRIVTAGLAVCALISFALVFVNMKAPMGLIYCGVLLTTATLGLYSWLRKQA